MAKRPLRPEDLWRIPTVGAPCPSPDGRRLLVPVTTHDLEAKKSETRLWLHERDRDPRALTVEGVSSSQPAWSPDGTRIAFVRKEGDGKPQIHVMPVDGGEARKITDLEEGAIDPRWFPDGKRIAFLGRARIHEPDEHAYVSEERMPRFWDRWLTDGLRWHLFVWDGENSRDLMPRWKAHFPTEDPAGSWDLAPDGREIAFNAVSSGPKQEVCWGVFRMRLRGGPAPATPVEIELPADHNGWSPRYSPDGKEILLGIKADPRSWATRTQLAVVDRRTGKLDVLAPHWPLRANEWEWDGRHPVCLADVEGRIGLFRVPRRGNPRELTRGGSFSGLRTAGGRIWMRTSSLRRPWEIFSCAPDGGDPRRETRHTAGILREFALGRVESVRFAGARGEPVQMFLLHPPGKPKRGKRPLLHLIHGGPHGNFGDLWHPRWNAQVFAAQGYLCAMVNFHGSTGWGQDFVDSIVGSWGDRPYDDVMAATDWLVERRNVDEKRMAISGGSYGGYLTSWIASQTRRFACAVNHAGVCDLQTQFGCEIPQGWSRQAGGDLWSGADAQAGLDRYNPLRHVGGIRTPMLILHGEKDYRVPYTQALQLYNILQMRGVKSRIVVYPDENHWILKPANSVHWYGEFLGWLKRWL